MIVIRLVTKKVEGVSADGSETKALSHDAWRQWLVTGAVQVPGHAIYSDLLVSVICRVRCYSSLKRVQSHVVAPKPGFLDAVGEPIHGKGVAR